MKNKVKQARLEDTQSLFRYITVVVLNLIMVTGCAGVSKQIETPRISVVNLHRVEATVFEQNYRIQLRIQNPNAFEIPVKGLQYNIELNDQHFASGVSNHSAVIPALDSAVIEVEAISTLLSFFRQFNNLQQGKLETISYRLNGKIHLTGLRSQPFDYSGKMLLNNTP
jgi:LEA14-like dessication related protein